MKWYRNFLCNVCNPRTGRGFWKWAEALGWLMMISWAAATLPWVGTFVGISSLGHFDHSGQSIMIVAYNGLFSVADRAAELYFFTIFIGVAFVKMGMLIQILGDNYRKGYIYYRPHAHAPLGDWIKS